MLENDLEFDKEVLTLFLPGFRTTGEGEHFVPPPKIS